MAAPFEFQIVMNVAFETIKVFPVPEQAFAQRLHFPSTFACMDSSSIIVFSCVSLAHRKPGSHCCMVLACLLLFWALYSGFPMSCFFVILCLAFWISHFTSGLISVIDWIVYLCTTFAWMWITLLINTAFGSCRISEQFHNICIMRQLKIS